MRLLGGVAILTVLPAGLLAALYWGLAERHARSMLAKRGTLR